MRRDRGIRRRRRRPRETARGSSSRGASSSLLREVLRGESRAYVDTFILLLP